MAAFARRPPPPPFARLSPNIYTMLDKSRKRWADIVYMLYKCFVFAGWNQWSQNRAVFYTTIPRFRSVK